MLGIFACANLAAYNFSGEPNIFFFEPNIF